MKVTQAEKTFKPVTIVLETYEELKELTTSLNTARGSYTLWAKLDSILNSSNRE